MQAMLDEAQHPDRGERLHSDSFSVCVFGIEIEQSRFEREVGRLNHDCNELRRLTKKKTKLRGR